MESKLRLVQNSLQRVYSSPIFADHSQLNIFNGASKIVPLVSTRALGYAPTR